MRTATSGRTAELTSHAAGCAARPGLALCLPHWWAAASALAATAATLLARAAPTGVGPYAMTAALFMAAAAAFCTAAADRKPHLLATAAALAAGAGIACGISAGTLRWPSSDASWVFAASYAWLAAQTAHLTERGSF